MGEDEKREKREKRKERKEKRLNGHPNFVTRENCTIFFRKNGEIGFAKPLVVEQHIPSTPYSHGRRL
jgi:hypothetical protein